MAEPTPPTDSELLAAIVAAWTTPVGSLGYMRFSQSRIRQAQPVLADALDAAMYSVGVTPPHWYPPVSETPVVDPLIAPPTDTELLAAVVSGWTTGGQVPWHVQQLQDRVRDAWPTLGAALDRAAGIPPDPRVGNG